MEICGYKQNYLAKGEVGIARLVKPIVGQLFKPIVGQLFKPLVGLLRKV